MLHVWGHLLCQWLLSYIHKHVTQWRVECYCTINTPTTIAVYWLLLICFYAGWSSSSVRIRAAIDRRIADGEDGRNDVNRRHWQNSKAASQRRRSSVAAASQQRRSSGERSSGKRFADEAVESKCDRETRKTRTRATGVKGGGVVVWKVHLLSIYYTVRPFINLIK